MLLTEQPVTERYLDTWMTWHVGAEASGGAFSLGEVRLQPGSEPPIHIHARQDEAWYVIEGTILFQRGMERIVRGPGESIFLPRGIPHGRAVRSASGRILHIYTPAGIERAFQALSVLSTQDPRHSIRRP